VPSAQRANDGGIVVVIDRWESATHAIGTDVLNGKEVHIYGDPDRERSGSIDGVGVKCSPGKIFVVCKSQASADGNGLPIAPSPRGFVESSALVPALKD
jgi:hypothetical protein